jgi:nitroreductase/NAD-dependent dihydropyrimidine dehydrogenase PreA subunit
MDETLSIDSGRCTKCGLCVTACRVGRITGTPGEQPAIADARCGLCGQCVAICPSMAISAPGFLAPPETTDLPETAAVDTLLMQKRSVRSFTSQPVDHKTLNTLIDVARHAPSAKNQQDRVFLLCTDPKTIAEMDRAVAESLGKMLKILNPITRMLLCGLPVVRQFGKIAASLKRLVQRSRSGESVVFYDAPCVIAVAGRKGSLLARDDAVIASQYIMLAAQGRQLGSCIIGYASTRASAIASYWDIPEGFAIESVFVVGHPAAHFVNIPPRNTAEVRWTKENDA